MFSMRDIIKVNRGIKNMNCQYLVRYVNQFIKSISVSDDLVQNLIWCIYIK